MKLKRCQENILCPKCKRSFTYKKISAIEWKQLVGKDNSNCDSSRKDNCKKAFSVKCPYCKEIMEHTHSLIVYCKEKRWAVQYIKENGKEVKPPFVLVLWQYQCRTTYSRESFNEKIAIFSNGLDDHAIELVKHYLKSGTKGHKDKNTQLFFVGLDILGDLIFKVLIMGSGKESVKREIGGIELYKIALSMVERIRKKGGSEYRKRCGLMVDYILGKKCKGLFEVVDSSTIEPLF